MTFKGQEVSIPGLPSVQPHAPNLYTLRPRSRVVRHGSARGRRGVRMIQKEELRGMKDRRWGMQRPFPRTPADQPDYSGSSVPATLSPAGYGPRVAKSQMTEPSTAWHLLRTQTIPSLLACSLSSPFPSTKADLDFHLLLDSGMWRPGNTGLVSLSFTNCVQKPPLGMRADIRLLRTLLWGTSLVVCGSDSALPMQGAQVPSLARGLWSDMSHSWAKFKKKIKLN